MSDACRVRSLTFRAVAQQAKKRRRKKHRGTQGGGIDTRGPARASAHPRGGSRSGAPEAVARQAKGARSIAATSRRPGAAPSSAALFGAAIFFLLFWLAFGEPVGAALALSAVMLAMYVPLGYYVDRFFFRRRLRQLQAARAAERKQERRGGRQE